MIVRRHSTIRQRRKARQRVSSRRGSMALAAMLSLLVIIGGVAVALDRLWLDNAKTELEAAVEAAALQGGQFLASDDLLREDSGPDIETRLELARQAAGRIARENTIAGEPVELNLTPDGDVRFGRLVRRDRTGVDVFLETSDHPTSVVVRGLHSRERNNPVATFLNSVTGHQAADVSALSEASIDNRVIGLQPLAGVPIPVLPLAILRECRDGRLESWKTQIEDNQGVDLYGYDELTGEVTDGPDGIPEIRLRSPVRRGNPRHANVHLFDVNGSSTVDELLSHIENGWGEQDVPEHLPAMLFEEGPFQFETVSGINGPMPGMLNTLIGECRILFLYDDFQPNGRSGAGRIQVVEAVAGRILSIEDAGHGCCELIVQPGVMTTRTAILSSESPSGDSTSDQTRRTGRQPNGTASEKTANRYIYKLQITN